MTFDEFRKSTLKVSGKRHHRIKNSYGVRDCHKWIRQNNWLDIGKHVSEKDFYAIVRTINNLLAEELAQGKDVVFPQRMGQLEVRKFETYVEFKGGKIHSNRGVDWYRTLKLWHEDEEAKEQKVLVKMENPNHFTIYYCPLKTNYKNRTLIKFKPNRELGIKINKLGQEGVIDAYKIGR